MSFWVPVIVALFAWWFSTGLILWVVKSTDHTSQAVRHRIVWGSLPLLAAGIFGYWVTLETNETYTAYGAFLSALAIWGWIELAFLAGVITGPNRHPCPADRPEWERFIRAWGTIAYHEMLLAAACITLFLTAWHSDNTFGMWTFGVLFFARVSAKLNLFLGVPKINVDFLPETLSHLPSHFRFRALNWLFPVSVTALTFAVACWLERAAAAATPAELTGFALLTAITALALFEHWMMVLPIPDEKLWRWMMPSTRTEIHDPIATTKMKGGHHGL
ncbi:MAG: putative photosynthetic complex assembly protein PuhE [Pseudomonadota bacterium]